MRYRYSRKFVFVCIIIIALLIIFNILSTPPPTEFPPSSPGLYVESNHEFEKLQKDIEYLKTMDINHQTQISTLKDTIQQLQQQIKSNNMDIKNDNKIIDSKPVINKQKQKHKKETNIIRKPFKLMPENEIIYSDITISNIGISDTPTSPNSIIVKDINNNNVIYDKNNGIIYGNPLLISKCSNALTMDHEINVLSSISYNYNNFVPWFWSRESIGSVLQNKEFNIQSNILTSDNFNNLTNAIYIEINNNANDIMKNVLLKSNNLLQTINIHPNIRIQSKCGFTFVQHPITRFISGYFTINALLWEDFENIDYFPEIFEQFTFYKIVNNLKARLKAFINDLRKFHYLFIKVFPFMNILTTQIGQLSITQNDINYIFKYEYIQNQNKNILNDQNDKFCIDESDNFKFNNNNNIENININELGINKEYLLDKKFREWIGLKIELDENGMKYNDINENELIEMDILYIYNALDYELYSKIVEYYWQDFVCFDYSADYKYDVLDYLTKYQNKYIGFPIQNRTKTNWDKILEYYYSKQNNKKRHGVRGI